MMRRRAHTQRYSAYLLLVVFALVFVWLLKYISFTSLHDLQQDTAHSPETADELNARHGTISKPHDAHPSILQSLGVLASRQSQGWAAASCDSNRKLRQHSVSTPVGNLTLYIYDSFSQDTLISKEFLNGKFFEREEMAKFLSLSHELPLIDVGGNVGLLTLQAALQGRQVVAVEPIPENALRLCRSVVDFGHASLVHVIQNAVSSSEGNVTLAIGDTANARTQYEVSQSQGWGHDATNVYAIRLDRLLELVPFKRIALKIDVESHEGHVLAGAERLFQEIDIPLVWMEWEHVKGRQQFGGDYVISFMRKRNFSPYNLMTGQVLSTDNFMKWPFTVLWRKSPQ